MHSISLICSFWCVMSVSVVCACVHFAHISITKENFLLFQFSFCFSVFVLCPSTAYVFFRFNSYSDRVNCIVRLETETLHFHIAIAFQFLFNSLPLSLSENLLFRCILFLSISSLRDLDLGRRVLCPTFK